MQVNVIGAGVTGLCIATELADQGHQVRLFEKSKALGSQSCSWWAGGMLAPYCEAESAEPIVVKHGIQAKKWWQAKTGLVEAKGTLVIAPARDQAELVRFAKLTQGHQQLNAVSMAELEPELSGRFDKALYFHGEAHLEPRQALKSLASNLEKKACKVNYNFDVNKQPVPGADFVIDARRLAAQDNLPDLRGVKGEMIILSCPQIKINRTIRLLHPRIPIYLVPRSDGFYMLGATVIESDERHRVSARSMLELLSSLYALHPAFAEAEIVEIGVDARPAFADNLPHMLWQENRLYVNGLYRHGFLLAPALAQMTAQVVRQPKFKPEFMYEN